MDTITIRIAKPSQRQQFYINLLTPMQRTIALTDAGRNHVIDMETAKEEESAKASIGIRFGIEHYGLDDPTVDMDASNEKFAAMLESRLMIMYPEETFSIHINRSQDTLHTDSWPDDTQDDTFETIVQHEIEAIFNAPEVMQTIAVYYREV